MADIPDYMRGFDLDENFGVTPVSKPAETAPSIDPTVLENSNLELAKLNNDVNSIKSMMNEIMQIVAEKDTITEAVNNEAYELRFKDLEKVILPFLYNLMKSDEPYIHWPNRAPIIKAQIEKILKLTRG